MKICYIADAIIPSRTANSIHVMRMCDAYAALGHQVTLIVPHWPGQSPPVDEVYAYYGIDHRFAIRRIGLPQWNRYESAFYSLVLPVAAAAARPDLIHTRTLAAAWGLTRLLRQRVLLETHQPWSGRSRQQALFAEAAGSGRLQALVVITQVLAGHFAGQTAGVPVIVAPDGVASSLLAHPLSQAEARARLGLHGETRPIAVYTGHLYQGRGIELIVEVARQTPDYLFLMVGGTDEDVMAHRRAAAQVPNLCFAGFVPPAEVQSYLTAADVLLMPYAPRVYTTGGAETGQFASPMKMFEYMAAQRPILASTLPVLQEVLADGVNALMLPYDQPLRWVEALAALQANPELARSLGTRARADVEQYTWERRAQRILKQVNHG